MRETEAALRALFDGPPPSLGSESRSGRPDRKTLSARLDSLEAAKNLPPIRRQLLEGLALLWHDHWDAAHAVAQDHEGDKDFDLLHALAHRREGDYGNAAYWFRAAGDHPCYASLEKFPGYAALIADIKRMGKKDEAEAARLRALQEKEFFAFAGWILDA